MVGPVGAQMGMNPNNAMSSPNLMNNNGGMSFSGDSKFG
jgi:hypothetical protein